MATFKRGQKCKVARWDSGVLPEFHNAEVIFLKMMTVRPFFAPHLADCWVKWGTHRVMCYSGYLEPLTYPEADAFVESIKKLKPYEEPLVEKVTA